MADSGLALLFLAIEALSTATLVIVGGWQLREIKREAREQLRASRIEAKERLDAAELEVIKERTLRAAIAYSTDPIVDVAARSLRTGRNSGALKATSALYRSDVVTVLNFLDSIAIGVDQKLYDERIARDHLEKIVVNTCENYLDRGFLTEVGGLSVNDWPCLSAMNERWRSKNVSYKAR